jgi:hypothetical protein
MSSTWVQYRMNPSAKSVIFPINWRRSFLDICPRDGEPSLAAPREGAVHQKPG